MRVLKEILNRRVKCQDLTPFVFDPWSLLFLVIIIFTFSSSAYADVSTQILLPDAVGASNAWDVQTDPGVTKINNDTDTQADSWRSNTEGQLMHANVADWTLPGSNVVLKVRVNVRAQTAGNENINIGLDNNGTLSDIGSAAGGGASSGTFAISVAPTWTDYWEEWNTPPGGSWSLNNLRVRVLHDNIGGGSYNYVTKAWITIYYADVSAGYVLIRVRQGGTGDSTTIQGGVDLTQGTFTYPHIIEVQDSNTYNEAVTISGKTTDGTNTLTLRAQAGQMPIINGGGTRTFGVKVDGVSYVYVQSFDLTNFTTAALAAAVYYDNNADYGQIINNKIHDTSQNAITVDRGSDNLVIKWNLIYTIGVQGVYIGDTSGCLSPSIINNTFYNIGTDANDVRQAVTLYNGSNNAVVKNNIFWIKNGTASNRRRVAINVCGSETGFSSNYNLFYQDSDGSYNWFGAWTSGTCTAVTTLGAWQTASSGDANSKEGNPQFVAPGTDFHEKSTFGTYNAGSWDKYNVDSPAIDIGNPSDTYSNEVEDNGNRINAGVYGNTSQASLSGVLTGGGNDDTVNTWTGNAGTTSWNTANNWSKKTVPISTDNVYIPDRSNDPVLNVTTTVSSVTIDNYSNNSPAQTNGTLTLNNASYTLTTNGGFTAESATTYSQSAGALNITGAFTNSGTFTHSAGNITLAGNYNNSGTFNDTGGSWTLNGTGNQSITTDGDNFYNLRVNNTGGGGTSVSTASTINVTTHLTLQAANSFSFGNITVGGNFTKSGGGSFTHSGTLTFNGSSDQAITPGGAAFNNLTINNTGTTATVSVLGALNVNGNFTLTAGTFDLNSYTHTITDGVLDAFNINAGTLLIDTSTATLSTTLNVGTSGTLNMTGAGTLKLPTTGADIKGKFVALSSSGTPKVTTSGAEGTDTYSFVIKGTDANNKATVDILGLKFYSPDANGLKIGNYSAPNVQDWVNVTRIDQIDFQKGVEATGVYLNVYLASGSYKFKLNKFDRYCQYNVRLVDFLDTKSTANITMENSSGVKGDNFTGPGDTWTGESEDRDPDGNTHITWKYFKQWTGTVNTVWSNGNNWEGGVVPKGVSCLTTTPPCDDVLIGSAPYNPTLDVDAYVNEIQITSGGKLSLSTRVLTITGSTYRADNGTFEPNTGTVKFTGTATQTVNNALNPFYNLEIDKTGGTVNLGASLNVNNNIILTKGTIDLQGKTMSVSGTFTTHATNTTSINLPSTSSLSVGTLTLNSPSSLTLSGTSSLTASGTLTLSGSVTLSGSATLTNSSTLSITSTFSLQDSSTLNANGAVTVTGTFNASGTGPTVSGIGSFTVTTGSVNIQKLTFSNTNTGGLTIDNGNNISNLNNVNFSQARASGQFLYIKGTGFTRTLEGHSFASISGGNNVKVDVGGGTIIMSSYSGAGAGESYDSDPSEPGSNLIIWSEAKVWAGNYTSKLQLTVTNSGASALPNGAAVEYQFSHSAMIPTNCSQTDGDDFRIFYYDANSSHPTSPGLIKELDRVILNKNHTTGWNTTNTVIAFATEEQIAASGTSSEYWVVCGNATVTSPPANAANAGVLFFDGFESGNYTDGGWTTHGNNIVVTTSRKKSGSYAAGAEISVLFLSPSGFNKTISLSGYSNVYLFYERSTEDLGSGNVGYETAYTSGTETVLETNSNAGTTAFTLRNYTIPNTATSIRLSTLFSGALPLGTDGLYDDVRVYANQNGSVGTVACTGGCAWVDIKNKFSEWANFSPQGIPSSNDAVYLNGSTVYKPIVDASFANTILSLIVNNTTNTSADVDELLFSNNMTVTRDVTIATGTTVNNGANTINLGGNWANSGTFSAGTGTVNFNSNTTPSTVQSITGTTTFNNLTTANTAKVTVDANTTSGTITTIAASTEVEVSSAKSLKITGATATVNGTLDVEPGATLDLADATSLTVGAGATFEAIGTATNKAIITSSDTAKAAGYSFSVAGAAAAINANYYLFKYMGVNGIQIGAGATVTSLNNGEFDYLADLGTLLNFSTYDGANLTISTCNFKDSTPAAAGTGGSTKFNVRASTTTANTITFNEWSGAFAGEANDQDGPPGTIIWQAAVTPDMTSAVAVDDSGGGKGIQYGDKVTLTFSEATNGFNVTGGSGIDANLCVRLATDAGGCPMTKSWGTIVSANWSTVSKTNDTLTITLGSGATIEAGNIHKITIASGTIKDITGTNDAAGSPPNITGTFGADTPDMTSAEADDGTVVQVGIDNDDKVVLKFNTATNGSTFNITAANIDDVLKLNNSHTWKDGSGAIGSAAWSTATNTNDTLTITLSTTTSAPTVALGDSITISPIIGSCGSSGTGDDTTICDDQGINKAVGSLPNISGTFGAETTTVTSATASDASGVGPGVNAGDTVVLVFSTSTNGYALTSSNINTILDLPGAKTWLDGNGNIQSAVWTNSYKTLTITLSDSNGEPAIVAADPGPADTITIFAGTCIPPNTNTICNASNSAAALGSPIAIGGSFGTSVSPSWTRVPSGNTGFSGGVIVRSAGSSDKVFIGTLNNILYYYDANDPGLSTQTYAAGASITSGINVVSSVIYFVDANRTLYAVNAPDPPTPPSNYWAANRDLTTASICDATYNTTTAAPLLWTIAAGTRILLGCGKGIFARNQSDGLVYAGWGTNPRDVGGLVSGTVSIASTGSDNYLYIATEDTVSGNVHKIDLSTGAVVATFSTNIGAVKGSPFIRSGILYIGGGNGKFYAINTSNMTQSWVYSGAGSAYESSPFFSNNKIYVGNNDGKVYCLTTGGSVCSGNWPYYTGSAVKQLVVVYNNRVYFPTEAGKIYALDATTGSLMTGYPYNTGAAIKVPIAIRTSISKYFVGNQASPGTIYAFPLAP